MEGSLTAALAITPAVVDAMTDAELRQFRQLEAAEVPESLPEFFARVRPDLKHPEHLFAPGVDKLGNPARSLGETLAATINSPQQASFSTPPQFGKSILVLVALAWYASRVARSISAYVSYNDDIACAQSDICRAMCRAAGLNPRGSKSCIILNNGSMILFASKGGPLEGKPVTGIAILDDAYKNRAEAESGIEREALRKWFFSTFLGRTHPTTSVLVVGHRWTADDLIAEVDDAGFPWTNYPALWPDGRSLWESFKSALWLNARRLLIGPITWLSEYQGQPMSKGGRLFEGVYYYTTKDAKPGEVLLPQRHLMRVAIGVDLAYTEKTASDWSVAVALGEYNAEWYVLEAMRRQCKADVFTEELKLMSKRFPGARLRWHGSSTERGAADVIRTLGKIDLQGVIAPTKPYGRSLLAGAAWSRGAIHVPNPETAGGAQLEIQEFIRVVTTFAGGDGAEDDDVVALDTAHEMLPARALTVQAREGSPEWIMEQREKAQKQAIREVLDQQRRQGRNERRAR